MDSRVAQRTRERAEAPERAARNFDEECRAWDWARTAGISAEELRRALREALGG